MRPRLWPKIGRAGRPTRSPTNSCVPTAAAGTRIQSRPARDASTRAASRSGTPERDIGRAAERLLRVRQRELRSSRLQQNFRRPERLGERKRDVIELALRHPARRSLDVDPRCARSVFRPLVRAQTVPSPRRRDPLRRRPARYLARRVRPLLTRRVPRRFDAILRPVTPIAPVALRRRRVARPESVQRQRRFRRRARALTLLARSRRARAKPRRPRARELPHIERPSRRRSTGAR